jgi:hypothetical protein
LLKNAAQPVLVLVGLWGIGIDNLRSEAVLTTAIPTMPIVVMLALQYRVAQTLTAAALFFSVIASVVTLAAFIAVTSQKENRIMTQTEAVPPIISGPSQADGIARFALRTKYEDLTAERRERLKVSILDAVACAINALGAPPIEACRAQAEELGGPGGRCTLMELRTLKANRGSVGKLLRCGVQIAYRRGPLRSLATTRRFPRPGN